MKTPHHSSFLALALLMASAAQGQVTIGWDFGAASGNLAAVVNVPVPHLAISTMTSFTGQALTNANSSASTGYAGSSGSFNASFAAVSGAFTTATSSAFMFTLTPEEGYEVSVSTITFGSRSTASGPTSVAIRTSDDAFAAHTYLASVPAASTWTLVDSGILADISGSNDSPLTVRLYGFGGSSVASGNWRIDDVSVTVTVSAVAVPEPSTYAVIFGSVALAGMVIHRRRLQNAG